MSFRIRNLSDTATHGGTIGVDGSFRVSDCFIGRTDHNLQLTGTVHVIPVPAAVWLLGSALTAMAGIARRKAA